MIRRFLANALGRSSADDVGVDEAMQLVAGAADRVGVGWRVLDFQIWKYQRDHRSVDDC